MASSLPPASRLIVTGATGFVGSAFVRGVGHCATLSMGQAAWREAIRAADFRGAAVVHLAARVHDPNAGADAFETDNVEKTRVLMEAAAAGGAVRFVFASTVKVFGEESADRPFVHDDPVAPADAYANSKWKAEQLVREIAAHTGIAAVVVRIPLTYGAGARGNFHALVRMADTGWWLPFAAIANRRSLVHIEDLADALAIAAAHPSAPGRTLLAAHPEAVSTPRLLETIRKALGRPRRLYPVSPRWLESVAVLLGQADRMRRLTRSLEVDPGPLVRELGWRPRRDLEAGIADSIGVPRR